MLSAFAYPSKSARQLRVPGTVAFLCCSPCDAGGEHLIYFIFILFYFNLILFYFILFYFILFYFILFYFILVI